jgi:hypothetical protein
MRGSGVVALLLLTLVFALGIATSKRFRPRKLPLYVTTTVHRNASLVAVAFLGIHISTAVLDTYSHVPLAAVLVPFASTGGRSGSVSERWRSTSSLPWSSPACCAGA